MNESYDRYRRYLSNYAETGLASEPVPFSSVIGHRPVVDLLRETVRRGRVPQSLLFAGPGRRGEAYGRAGARAGRELSEQEGRRRVRHVLDVRPHRARPCTRT